MRLPVLSSFKAAFRRITVGSACVKKWNAERCDDIITNKFTKIVSKYPDGFRQNLT